MLERTHHAVGKGVIDHVVHERPVERDPLRAVKGLGQLGVGAACTEAVARVAVMGAAAEEVLVAEVAARAGEARREAAAHRARRSSR